MPRTTPDPTTPVAPIDHEDPPRGHPSACSGRRHAHRARGADRTVSVGDRCAVTITDDIARAIQTHDNASVVIVSGEDFDAVERDEYGQINGVPVVPSRSGGRHEGAWIVWLDRDRQPCIAQIRR